MGSVIQLAAAFIIGFIGSAFGVKLQPAVTVPTPPVSSPSVTAPASAEPTVPVPTVRPSAVATVRPTTPQKVNKPTATASPKPVTLTFVKPQNGRVFTSSQQLDVELTGTGPVGRVEFFIQSGYSIKSFMTPPYVFTYDLPSHMRGITGRQNMMLEAVAYDAKGQRTASGIVRFYVDPAPTPTATPQPAPVASSNLRLMPPPGSPVPGATGTMHIDLTQVSAHYSGSPDYRIFSFTWNGRVEGLKPDRTYKLLVCMRSLTECGSSGDMNMIRTDSSGNADFRLPAPGSNMGGVGYTVKRDNPISSVIVVGQEECASNTSPCLRAEYPLGGTGF